jgi:hypothetical protein
MDVPPTVDAAVDKLTHQLGHRGHPAAVTYTGVLDAIVSPAPIEVLDAVPSCAPRHLQCREPFIPHRLYSAECRSGLGLPHAVKREV